MSGQCYLGGRVCRIGIPSNSLKMLRNFRGSGWAAVECTAKPFLPGVARKEHRTAARVKAEGMRTRSAARLYARRSAGKMHVAGKDGEDRLAILSWTLANLWLAARKYSASISMPAYLRPVSSAAAQVDAEPQKGSSTSSPGCVKAQTKGTSDITAFCVGWSALPV